MPGGLAESDAAFGGMDMRRNLSVDLLDVALTEHTSREVSLHVAKTSQSTSRAPANSDVRRMPGATALIAHHDEAVAESSASQLESRLRGAVYIRTAWVPYVGTNSSRE